MKKELKNYGLLLISILIVGFAITLITKAGLGATAVTSLAFVISELSGISFGVMTGIFNILWILLQIVIQRKSFPKIQLLQFVVAFIIGFAVDLANVILRNLVPQTYLHQLAILLFGCIVMGFGVFLQLKAAKVYNPAEGIVAAITNATGWAFGTVKTLFDSTLVILSIIVGILATGQLVGIREGTIISALLIGPIIGLFQKVFASSTDSTKA